MEVVLDTNVAVSAAINPKGPPALIIKVWRAQSFTWVTSESLLTELERTLRSPKIHRHIAWSDQELNAFLAAVNQLTRITSPTRTIDIIKVDPADNRVLEAAVAGGVDYVVTGDRHLLDIGDHGGIPIVTPARFVAIIATGLEE
jgi:putative PIN family toxin of toxin-antitoxin system